MVNITFVIGANATGKSYFISQNYEKKDVVILNVYDYQQREYDVAGYEDSIPFDAQYDCLRKANAAVLNDVIEYAKQGRDVVLEQTFFKAKRRIAYIEEIRKNVEATIDVYVMSPDDRLLESNLEKRDMLRSMGRIKRDIEEQLEFPNPAEGFDHIYKMVGSECTLVMKESDPTIVDTAHKELAQEEAYIREKELEKQERKKLLDSMKTRKFWHYCEVCGKKEFITAKEAHNLGWDYPPLMGAFKMLSPRTCGDCPMDQTLFYKIHSQQPIPIVIESRLTKEELIVWERIKGEPESLLD